MGRRAGGARSEGLEQLKQAAACIARAIELHMKDTDEDDKNAKAQAELGYRFLDNFVDP